MRVWRISRYATLDGRGGLIDSGRWHTAPQPVIYCADHPSTALLEVFVHLEVDPEDLPDDYKLIEIDVPDHLGVKLVSDPELPENWRYEETFTQQYGNQWLASLAHVMLSMRSAVLPVAQIFLLNCSHKDFPTINVIAITPHDFDSRLWKSN